ncbi:hypothetical protein JIY74_26590 [Vibrio harveyi]|nr:hypothetical protein [Vibrio harveyi]
MIINSTNDKATIDPKSTNVKESKPIGSLNPNANLNQIDDNVRIDDQKKFVATAATAKTQRFNSRTKNTCILTTPITYSENNTHTISIDNRIESVAILVLVGQK